LVTVDRSAPPIGGRARPRSGVWLAWLAFGAALAMVAVAVGLWFLVHRPVPGAMGYAYWREATINGLAYATVGVLVASRRPEHPIGWLFLGAALVAVAQAATGEYAAAFLAASGPSTRVAVAAWASYQLQLAVVGVLASLLVLFPTGRPPSRRWWVPVWAIAAGMALTWVGDGLSPTRYEDFPEVDNPFGIAAMATALGWVAAAGTLLSVLGLLGALVSLLVRFARARGLERQQLKWFVYAAAVGLAMLVLLGELGVAGSLVWTLAPVSLAVAVALAVLRYRLYDIDRLLNRTLVYGLLTVLLGLGYAGTVVVLGQLFGRDRSNLAVASATLAAAALFQPARRRIQTAVDRRFNRRRYDTARTIAAFSTRLRDQVDLDTLSAELLAVVDQTMEPTTASLWLRPWPGRHPRPADRPRNPAAAGP
jgi:MFS family permease